MRNDEWMHNFLRISIGIDVVSPVRNYQLYLILILALELEARLLLSFNIRNFVNYLLVKIKLKNNIY